MIFRTEVIYSAFTLFQGIGMLFGFLVTTYCCTNIKIIILICLSGVSALCGIWLYIRQKKEKKYLEKTTELFETEKLNAHN